MTTAVDTDNPPEEGPEGLEGGSYEVIRQRLLTAAQALNAQADRLNRARTEKFGGVPLQVIGNERVRTDNNCVPRDIVNIGGTLLLAYNVYIGLRTETHVGDVFSLHNFGAADSGFDLSARAFDTLPGLLDDPAFVREFEELYSYYKETKLLQVRRTGGKLLAVFQVGNNLSDIKAFRWLVDADERVRYVDNRGERDHSYLPPHDFEWVATGREHQVTGRHPHVNVLDQVFVEMVGGDLTVKVENNTEDGKGIYREPVDDPRQSLDDGEVHYARVGGLILLKMLPYRETEWRYLVFNTRTQDVRRIDAIGQSCIQLPEDHGIVFPGGYYLQTGDGKVFDTAIDDLVFKQSIRSPNGEDVLYVYYHQLDGRYLLLPYNLIKKEVVAPIQGHGYTLFDDGKMLVFRSVKDEPTRVHPVQVWQTPFVSDEFAAQAPSDDSALGKIGNADLVRGISDAYSIVRLARTPNPTRQTFEDLIATLTRMKDAYYWLGKPASGEDAIGFAAPLDQLSANTELIIDEFEKVQTLTAKAAEALDEAKQAQQTLIRDLRPDDWRDVADFLTAMTRLRQQRGSRHHAQRCPLHRRRCPGRARIHAGRPVRAGVESLRRLSAGPRSVSGPSTRGSTRWSPTRKRSIEPPTFVRSRSGSTTSTTALAFCRRSSPASTSMTPTSERRSSSGSPRSSGTSIARGRRSQRGAKSCWGSKAGRSSPPSSNSSAKASPARSPWPTRPKSATSSCRD